MNTARAGNTEIVRAQTPLQNALAGGAFTVASLRQLIIADAAMYLDKELRRARGAGGPVDR